MPHRVDAAGTMRRRYAMKKTGKGTKKTSTAKAAKGTDAPKAAKERKPKKVSALDAAAHVLAKSDRPMAAQELIVAMAEQELWKSPSGKTPHATLYSAIIREIGTKGKDARFKKVERGLFTISEGSK